MNYTTCRFAEIRSQCEDSARFRVFLLHLHIQKTGEITNVSFVHPDYNFLNLLIPRKPSLRLVENNSNILGIPRE